MKNRKRRDGQGILFEAQGPDSYWPTSLMLARAGVGFQARVGSNPTARLSNSYLLRGCAAIHKTFFKLKITRNPIWHNREHAMDIETILIDRGFVRRGCFFSRHVFSRNMFSRNMFSRNMFSRNECFRHFVFLEMRVI